MMKYLPLLGIAALNPTYGLTNFPDFIRATDLAVAAGRSGLDRDPGVVGPSRPRPLLRATVIGRVKRHPPYGLLRSPDAIRERPPRRPTDSPDCPRSVGCAVRTTPSVDGAHGLGGPAEPYGSGL